MSTLPLIQYHLIFRRHSAGLLLYKSGIDRFTGYYRANHKKGGPHARQ